MQGGTASFSALFWIDVRPAIELPAAIQHDYYDKLSEWLTGLYPKGPQTHDSLPMYHMGYQSALGNVEVRPWGKDKAVVAGTRIGTELLRYLLRQNEEIPVGGFYLDDKENV